MKRLHVHVSVRDLDASVRFYSELFAARPTVLKPDYAKWMLDDPRVNFAISARGGAQGVQHLGIPVEDRCQLSEVFGRLARAARPVLEQTAATCCYAKSDKQWASDPQGVACETFPTHGESTVYGESGTLQDLADVEDPICCGPAAAKAACCSQRA